MVKEKCRIDENDNLRNPSVNFGDCQRTLLAESLFNELGVGVRRLDGWWRRAGTSASSG
jgi:hypothetical protein